MPLLPRVQDPMQNQSVIRILTSSSVKILKVRILSITGAITAIRLGAIQPLPKRTYVGQAGGAINEAPQRLQASTSPRIECGEFPRAKPLLMSIPVSTRGPAPAR